MTELQKIENEISDLTTYLNLLNASATNLISFIDDSFNAITANKVRKILQPILQNFHEPVLKIKKILTEETAKSDLDDIPRSQLLELLLNRITIALFTADRLKLIGGKDARFNASIVYDIRYQINEILAVLNKIYPSIGDINDSI